MVEVMYMYSRSKVCGRHHVNNVIVVHFKEEPVVPIRVHYSRLINTRFWFRRGFSCSRSICACFYGSKFGLDEVGNCEIPDETVFCQPPYEKMHYLLPIL